MKKILLVISLISILFLVGCNEKDLPQNVENQQKEEIINNEEVVEDFINLEYTSLDVLKNQKRVPMEAEIGKLYDIGNVKIGNNIFDLKYVKSEKEDDEAPTGFSIEERLKFYKDDAEKLELLVNTEVWWGEYTKEISIFKDKYLVTVSMTNTGDSLQFLEIYDQELNKVTNYEGDLTAIYEGSLTLHRGYDNYYLVNENNITFINSEGTKITRSVSEVDGKLEITVIDETTEGVLSISGRT